MYTPQSHVYQTVQIIHTQIILHTLLVGIITVKYSHKTSYHHNSWTASLVVLIMTTNYHLNSTHTEIYTTNWT